MPASIPDRYSLEVRLGRDGDIEEWLATDTSLDRPVLIRSLGPESSEQRRKEFVEAVSGAAKVTHAHLARVFTVATVDGGAYAVSEWTGGATLHDRVTASQPIDLPEFLPNAAGLAGALAALHANGVVHGHIDPSAVSYSAAHPAKLGAFGRPPLTDAEGDVGKTKPPYKQRKEAYIAHVASSSPSTRLVSASDKLHNARSIVADLRVQGNTLWSRFNGGRDDSLWYYRALVTAFRKQGGSEAMVCLVDELDRVVTEMERLAATAPA